MQELGKRYPWVKPYSCPACKSQRLWGHGYVKRYFQGIAHYLWLKRYRCSECHRVHTLRPIGYQGRILHSQKVIRSTLLNKIKHGVFKKGEASRQVQSYWWSNLILWFRRISLELDFQKLATHLKDSIHLQVSRTLTDRLISYKVCKEGAYLPFALSTSVTFG